MFGRRSSTEYRPSRARRGVVSYSGRDKEPSARRRAPVGVKREARRERSSFFSSWDWNKIRIWTVGLVFSLLWVTLWGRAYYLQMVKGPEYAAMAKRQHTASEVVRGIRGNILDRNGNVIARSVECESVWANPSAIQDKDAATRALAPVLNLPAEKVASLLAGPKRFVWVKRKVDFHTAEAVRALKIRGVYLDVESERIYPYRHLAGQLLGFVNIDDKGIEGLEKAFESELAGREVTSLVERDASGRRFVAAGSGSLVDLRGNDVRLTIDTQVQFFAEEALAENVQKYGARWGGCIVVDVPSGDVLAWAQYPFFDPNNVGATAAPDRRNRLAMDALEQGSTIKSFLVAAALQDGVVDADTIIDCERGKWKLGRVILHDTHAYAKLPVRKILHVSSNIGVAKIGLKLGAQRYYDYLSRLGFGRRTGLPLAGEVKGILRPARKWAEIDLAASSFGQSFSATLAQMAQAYLCLAGGGMAKPLRLNMDDSQECRIGLEDEAQNASLQARSLDGALEALPAMDSESEQEPSRVFDEATMREVRSMLREVVEEEGGTGKQARIPGLVVGGKTGTAQKADNSGKYGKGRVGSFVGMLPIENPRYLICVLLDEPSGVQYGGVIAAPVFRHVALHTMAYHGHLPDTDDPIVKAVADKEQQRRKNPQAKKAEKGAPVIAPASGAAPAAQRSGAKPGSAAALVLGSVSSQSANGQNANPAPFAEQATSQADGRAYTEQAHTEKNATNGSVPSVVGMGLRRAVEIFASQGIVPAFEGKGTFVVRQSPLPGGTWPEGTKKCTLWLEERAL